MTIELGAARAVGKVPGGSGCSPGTARSIAAAGPGRPDAARNGATSDGSPKAEVNASGKIAVRIDLVHRREIARHNQRMATLKAHFETR